MPSIFSRRFVRPRAAHATLNVTGIEKEGRGRRMPSRRREEETPRQDNGKARREMQHPIYF
jgi:hypothetical protein